MLLTVGFSLTTVIWEEFVAIYPFGLEVTICCLTTPSSPITTIVSALVVVENNIKGLEDYYLQIIDLVK